MCGFGFFLLESFHSRWLRPPPTPPGELRTQPLAQQWPHIKRRFRSIKYNFNNNL